MLNFFEINLYKKQNLQNTSGFSYMCFEYGVCHGTLHLLYRPCLDEQRNTSGYKIQKITLRGYVETRSSLSLNIQWEYLIHPSNAGFYFTEFLWDLNTESLLLNLLTFSKYHLHYLGRLFLSRSTFYLFPYIISISWSITV